MKSTDYAETEIGMTKEGTEMDQGEVVRTLREQLDMKQKDLAKKAGIAQPVISHIETGRIRVSVERSKKLAKVLNVHPAVLVFGDLYDQRKLLKVPAKKKASKKRK